MKRQIVFILFILYTMGFSSCTTYYYSRVDTTQWENVKNDEGDFVQENDSVIVGYCFYGENMPVTITVINKLDQPIVLDWRQSALIVEDAANSYFPNTVPVRGQMRSSTYSYLDYLGYSDARGDFSGEMTLPEGTAFIPPKSKITSTPITLANFVFENIPKDAYSETTFATKSMGIKKVRVLNFVEEDTPLRFRSYLTLYTISPDGSRGKSMAFEQSFYISQLMRAGGISPSEMLANEQQRGDFFYVRKESGSSAGFMAGVIALGVAATILDAAVSY